MKQIIAKTAIAAIGALTCFDAHAQNEKFISGSIADSVNSQPLPGATIILKKLSGEGITQTTVCDAKGSFNFTNLDNGYYGLEVFYTGYKKANIDSIELGPNKNAALYNTIQLAHDNKTLAGVMVTAKQPLITQSAGKIVFNVGQTSLAAGSNAYELIKTAPEVIADQNGNFSVRGQNVLVTIDGRQTNLSGDDLKSYLANIPGTSVDKIEVITNPSAKYDAQGGAIINIKTSKPANLGTNGTYTAGIGMGKYAKYNTGITLNHRSKTTNIYGSYNFDHNAPYNTDSHIQQVNGFPGKISEDERSTDKKNSQSFKLGLDHDFNKNNSAGILFKGNVNYKDMLVFNRSVAYTLSQQQADSSSTVNTNGNASVFSPSVNVYYRSVLNKKGGELNLNADWFIYSKKWKEDFVTNYFLPDGSFDKAPTYLRDNSPADNNVRSFAADYSQPITKGKLEAGIKTTFTKTDNNVLWENKLNNTWVTDTGKTNRFIYRENINAAYISINKAAGKYNLTGGLRAEQTNTSGDLSTQRTDKTNYINLFPNFSAVYIKDAKNMFIFNYKKSIVRYGFNYVNPFITYQSQYSYSQGNPYLKPQINNSLSLTWSYKQFLFSTISYVHASGALAPVYLPSNNPNVVISSYDNLRSFDKYSASITASKHITKWWQAMASGTALHVVYKNDDAKTAFENNSGITAVINSINTFTLTQKINADLTVMYISPLASGIFQLESIFTANAGISTTILKDKGTLKLNVSDLFNTYRTKYTVNYGDVQSAYNSKDESRFINLQFTYKFGNSKVKDSKLRKAGIDDEKNRMDNN